MKEGKQEGEWQQYLKNGKLYLIMNYKNGKIHGDVTVFDSNGDITRKTIWDKQKLIKETNFH